MKKMNLFKMLIIFSLIPLVLSVLIISITSLYTTKNELENATKNTLFVVANNLASHCNENQISQVNASGYYTYLDSLKEHDIEMAIILESGLCVTSIKNENDYRIREIQFEEDIFADKSQLEAGYYAENVVINEQLYYAYCMPIFSGNEIIGVAFAAELEEYVTSAASGAIVIYVIAAIVLIAVCAVVTLYFSKYLSKVFTKVGKRVDALANGDLSKQEEYTSAVVEMNTLLSQTKQMQESMADTIGKVKEVSECIVERIGEVTRLSESSNGRAAQITSAMGELSAATMNMAESVQDINNRMQEIGICVNDISENVEHLYHSSGNILKTNDEARENMQMIMHNNVESFEAVNGITEQIKQTNDSIAEIDKAVKLILDISDQTNLLSLNASIEAARAGDAGRGFAVVAEEIRHLSEQSAQGAEMIKELANNITEQSNKSVQLADGVRGLMLLEQENVSKTQQKYEELSEDIKQSVTEIESIAKKTENLTNYKEHVIGDVQDLSAISEQNAASNQEVNANVCEIIAEIQSVSESSTEMNRIAVELENSVSYFKV